MRAVYADGCGRVDCYHCAKHYGYKRAKKAWKRALGWLTQFPWAYLVFALPSEHRALATKERLRALEELVLHRIFRFFSHLYGLRHPEDHVDCHRLGALSVWHPTGENRDRKRDLGHSRGTRIPTRAEEYVPHLNIIIPMVAFGRTEDDRATDWNFAPLGAKLRGRDLEELRAIWKATLRDIFGFGPPTEANVWYGFRGGDPTEKLSEEAQLARQRHVLRYCLRAFPGWPAWTRTITYYGYLAPRLIARYRDFWTLGGARDATRFNVPSRCACCGARLERREIEPRADVGLDRDPWEPADTG